MDCTEKMAALRAKLPAEEMISQAFSAMAKAYAPYSGFKVGAALLTADGIIYQGCNIENAAYTPSNCAERTAFFKAVSEGVREFTAICIVGGKDGVPEGLTAPCGVCRHRHRRRPRGGAPGLRRALRRLPPGNDGILRPGDVSDYSAFQQGGV